MILKTTRLFKIFISKALGIDDNKVVSISKSDDSQSSYSKIQLNHLKYQSLDIGVCDDKVFSISDGKIIKKSKNQLHLLKLRAKSILLRLFLKHLPKSLKHEVFVLPRYKIFI